MALGTFTLRIDADRYDGSAETSATVKIRRQGPVDYFVDPDANLLLTPFTGPKGLAVSMPYTVTLPTDATSGTSTTIGYTVTVTPKHGQSITSNFAAPAAGTTLELADAVETVVVPPELTGAQAADPIVATLAGDTSSATRAALNGLLAAALDVGGVQRADAERLLTDVLTAGLTRTVATQNLYQRTSMGSFRALAVDPNVAGRVWGVSSGGVSYHDSHGSSARVDVGAMPSAQSGVQMIFTSTHLFMVTAGVLSREGQIWRSPIPASSGTPTLTWTKIFDLANFTTTLAAGIAGGENSYFREQSLAIDTTVSPPTACVLEYGTTVTGGPSIYYSANITVTDVNMLWTKRNTWANAKHGHGVAFINGTYWAIFGDSGFTDLGLWRGAANGASWVRRSLYGEAAGGNTLYGINLHPMTLNGAPVIITDNDTRYGESVLMFPSQSAVSTPLVPLVSAKPPYNTGTVRSIRQTSEGNLMWVQTGENGAVNPYDSIWISKGPDYREAVLLEAIPSTNALGTLGKAVESGDYVFVGTYRLRKEKFLGQ